MIYNFYLNSIFLNINFKVWIVYGDGSCGYSIAEIDTFTRHKVSLFNFDPDTFFYNLYLDSSYFYCWQ